MAGHVTSTDNRNAYNILLEKPKREELLEEPNSRYKDNIKIDIK
jgi:hypothetical protein